MIAVQGLRKKADDANFQSKWQAMKLEAKKKAVKKVEELTGVQLHPEALMDVQVKRIHEYKRQLLNLLSIVHRYHKIKQMSPEERLKVSPCLARLCLCQSMHDALQILTYTACMNRSAGDCIFACRTCPERHVCLLCFAPELTGGTRTDASS